MLLKEKKEINFFLRTFLILLLLSSCSLVNNFPTANISGYSNLDIPKLRPVLEGELKNLKQLGIIENNAEDVLITDLGHGKKGGSFSINVNFNNSKDSFNTKNSVSGSPGRTNLDVDRYSVFLFEGASGGYVGTDPYATIVSSLLPVANPTHLITKTIAFSNVPPNNSGQAYYVAVIAEKHLGGSSYINIGKPNPSWNGATLATFNKKVSISSTGGAGSDPGTGDVTVDNQNQVNSLVPLSVSINLDDVIAPILETKIIPTNGSSIIIPIDAN